MYIHIHIYKYVQIYVCIYDIVHNVLNAFFGYQMRARTVRIGRGSCIVKSSSCRFQKRLKVQFEVFLGAVIT